MGYTVTGGGTIKVRPEQEADAVAALQRWARDEKDGHVGYAAPGQADAIAAATTVADVFAQFGGMDVAPDDDAPGTFDLGHGDSWSQDYDEAARIIGPFVDAGCTVEWTGEEGEHTRWRFTGTEMIEETGRVVFETEATALDQDGQVVENYTSDVFLVGIALESALEEAGCYTARSREEWHQALHALLARLNANGGRAFRLRLGLHDVDFSWWVAEDDRRDGSDNDSAVFVPKGTQERSLASAEALDRVADLFRLPEWRIGDSAADFIECVAEQVKKVRPIDGPPSEKLLREVGDERWLQQYGYLDGDEEDEDEPETGAWDEPASLGGNRTA